MKKKPQPKPEPDAMVAPDTRPRYRNEPPEPEPIIYIEYHKTKHGWKPDQVLTDRSCFDFDWCEKPRKLCYHESGGGPMGDIGLGDFCAVLDAKKANQPVPLVAKVWYDRTRARLHHDKRPVTDRQARDLGYQVLAEPLEEHGYRNPFEWDASESNVEWCTQCKSYQPADDDAHCAHLKWSVGEGLTLGCGASEVNLQETRRSFYRLLRILPLQVVEKMQRMYSAGGTRPFTMDSMLGGDFSLTLYGRGKTGGVHIKGEYVGDELNYEERYWPGFAWLMSLDHNTKGPNIVTAGWIWQWQHERRCGDRVVEGNRLVLEVSDAELDKWLALDPQEPRELHEHPLDVSTIPKNEDCRNDLLFRQIPAGTTEVTLIRKRRRRHRRGDEYREITLSVAEVKRLPRRKVRVFFGRVITRNGKHISELEDYRLAY